MDQVALQTKTAFVAIVSACSLAWFSAACFSSTAWAARDHQTSSSTFPKPTETRGVSEQKPHVGIMLGFTGQQANYGSSAEYGIDIGFQPYIPFGAGIELSGSNTDRTRNGRMERLTRTNLLAKGTYNFGGSSDIIRNSYVGLGLGPIFDSTDTHFGIAPMAGFDIPFRNKPRQFLSLGLYAKYLFVSGVSPNAFSMNGVLKYWF